jgi:hypothetical protein
MTGEEIKFTITKKGITVETSGFAGGACLKELESFREYMASKGVKITETHQDIKPEMYESSTTEQKTGY